MSTLSPPATTISDAVTVYDLIVVGSGFAVSLTNKRIETTWLMMILVIMLRGVWLLSTSSKIPRPKERQRNSPWSRPVKMENDVVPAGRTFRVLVIIETYVCWPDSFRWTPAFFRLDKSVLQDNCKLKYNLLKTVQITGLIAASRMRWR